MKICPISLMTYYSIRLDQNRIGRLNMDDRQHCMLPWKVYFFMYLRLATKTCIKFTWRDVILKPRQIMLWTFSNTIPILYPDQNNFWKCTTKHIDFGAECKMSESAAFYKFWVQGKNELVCPYLLSTFYQFPDRFSLTLQCMKN